MRTIIAGSRGIASREAVEAAIAAAGFDITEVVSGGARGVDRLGEAWAKRQRIPVRQFIPAFQRFGPRAALLRNADMAAYAEALIAVWDGRSRGTADMINKARERGLRVFVHRVALVMERSA